MFDEFLKNCPMEDEIKPSKERVKNNIDALNSLIETEEGNMTKRGFRLKPLLIAAVMTVISLSLVTVSYAATQNSVIHFVMGGRMIEGEYYDYVDKDGFRHISFGAALPIDAEDFAVIYDVDAPKGENVRVITDETDPDFMEKLRLFKAADYNVWKGARNAANKTGPKSEKYTPLKPENFGLVLKDSEICTFQLYSKGNFEENFEYYSRTLDGKFMHTGAAEGMRSEFRREYSNYDYVNRTKTFKITFYYYVGKE